MSITPELYDFIVKLIEEKVREMKVAREAFDKLASTVRSLTRAQRRTEERLNQLAEAQSKTEEHLNQLAEAVDKLVMGLDSLRVEVGRLSEVVGFGLEDVARGHAARLAS